MSTEIVEFSKKLHLEHSVDVLLLLRKSGENYPPAADADEERGSLGDWLLSDEVLARWVAVVKGQVVGHIQVTKPHHYIQELRGNGCSELLGRSDLAEIGKFFVSPMCQEGGIGTQLFDQARSFIRGSSKMPVLVVLPTSTKALEFYQGKGMDECGSFVGVHGENVVFIDAGAA